LRGRASGGHGDYWNVESIARYCPELIPFPFGGLFHPTDGQVTASRAAEAFRRGAVASGAVVREGQRVTGLLRRGRRVVGVRVGRDRIVAGMTLLCLGARGWALTDSLGWRPPIFPVRGEIMIFRPVRRLLPVPVFLGESGVYMVPKPDGTFLVGATSTRTGRAVFTAAGQKRLSASALAALPALADAPYLGGWAGLRPGTPDGWPLLGPVPEWDGVWIAAGHFRRGVLLAPATGLWMAEAMTGAPRASMARFSPARFSKEPVVL
jgi:glycine oxidase